MIFYKLLEISPNFVKVEFCQSFAVGQNVQIIDFEDYLENISKTRKIDYQNYSKSKKNLSILGIIIQINSEFVLIKTFKTLENLKINNLVIQTFEKNILPFSPTLLGRFWSNFDFLETFWQEEEKAGKLLGSRLLTGKIVEYGQDSPNWKNDSQNSFNNWQKQNSQSIKLAEYKNNQQIRLNLTFANPIFKEIFNFPFDIKIGESNSFLQNSISNLASNSTNFSDLYGKNSPKINTKIDLISTLLQIIEQIKNNFDQPIFLIITESLSLLQLKDFYFKLFESEGLFNSFVLDSRGSNKIILGEIWELANFLSQNLGKKVFIISENIKITDQIQNQDRNNLNQNQKITFIQV